MRLLRPFLAALIFAVPACAGILGEDFSGEEDREYRHMPALTFAFEAGYSHWFIGGDSVSASEERFLDNLKNGPTGNAQVVWWPWPQGGVGVECIAAV